MGKRRLLLRTIDDLNKQIQALYDNINIKQDNYDNLCKLIKSLEFQRDTLLSEIEKLEADRNQLYAEIFFGNDYMPLLIRGNTKQEKADKFIDILDKMMAISNTIQFDNSMSSVIKQLQSKSNISSFYSNYIVVRFNSLTNHLIVDDIHLGPGSLKTMNYVLSKRPKNHKAEMYVLKALQKEIKETNNIELELYDIENQMCEFQKTL